MAATAHKRFELRRAELETRIEELIALLNDIDGDEDLEDGFDAEPSIGTACFVNGRLEYDVEKDTADDEPDLGWSAPRCGNLDHAPGWLAIDSSLEQSVSSYLGEGQHIAQDLIRKHIADPAMRERALQNLKLPPDFGGRT